MVGLFTLGTLGFKGAVWVFTCFICTGVLFTVVGVFTGEVGVGIYRGRGELDAAIGELM